MTSLSEYSGTAKGVIQCGSCSPQAARCAFVTSRRDHIERQDESFNFFISSPLPLSLFLPLSFLVDPRMFCSNLQRAEELIILSVAGKKRMRSFSFFGRGINPSGIDASSSETAFVSDVRRRTFENIADDRVVEFRLNWAAGEIEGGREIERAYCR